MKTLRLICLSAMMVGCGETTAPEATTTATAPVAPTAAAPVEAPAPAPAPTPAAPAMIGNFGLFQLSANSFATDGRCMEVAANLPADPAAAAEALAALRSTAAHFPAGPDAVSTDRCPTADRVPGLCAMTMGLGAYITYFYSSGPHATAADAAPAACTEMHGEWTP